MRPKIKLTISAAVLLSVSLVLFLSEPARGGEAYPIDGNATVIGKAESYTVSGEESLHEVAVRTGVGYNEIVDANPGVDPWLPGDGTEILIPRMFVLPHAAREGILINLAEMRLYHYMEAGGRRLVRTYPVGIGREAFGSPLGSYRIVQKLKDPSWVVPESLREEDPSLPRVVPPGPANPLGKFALRLSSKEYMIHGTNRPFGIGRRVSRGCVRMYAEDIAELFGSVSEDETAEIVYQAVKAGERDGTVYIEVHGNDIKEGGDLWDEAVERLRSRNLLGRTDSALLYGALRARTGVPAPVTRPQAVVPAVEEGPRE